MAIQVGRWKRWVVIASVLGAIPEVSIAQSQIFASQTAEATPTGYTAPVSLTGDDIVAKMLERNRLRNEQLRRYSAERTYVIRNLEGKLAAEAGGRGDYEGAQKKTVKKTSGKRMGVVGALGFDRL